MPLDPDLTEFTTASPVIATFSYENIESGVGYNTYYCLVTEDASVKYSLQPNTLVYSTDDKRETTQTGVGTTTLTFDTSVFNITRTVRGTAYMSLGGQHTVAAGDFKAQLFKWDGSSATAISSEIVISFTAGVVTSIFSFEMPCTETILQEGDQLRLVLKMVVGSGTGMSIGHDPKNLDGTVITPSTTDTITSTRINIPFKIGK